ncbi:MAG: hypothetical protein HFG83_03735 [Dorea sp.]|jgi:hypothetical protein|nr:hypothetical protein [Dorea sp.]MCI9452928.1 hypothetical protein [Dorea sp.]
MKVTNSKAYSDPKVALYQMDSRKSVENNTAAAQTDAASMIKYLKQTYKNINFSVISFENHQQISQYGAGQTGTNNVAISEELLEKMSTDENLRQHVENILNHMDQYQKSANVEALLKNKELVGMGLVIGEDGQVSKWTAMQKKDESTQPTWWRDKKSTSFYAKKKSPKVNSYSYSHTSSMMRLASARNVTSVKGLISAKYGEIQRVKSQVSDPAEAARIVRKIKSVIQSGNIKIARLHKEENLRLREKAAERKMKDKLALQLAQELKRKQKARMGQEHCQTATAHMDDVTPNSSMNDEQFKQMAEQYVDSLSPTALSAEIASVLGGTASAGVSVEVMSAPVTSVEFIDCSA